MPEWGSLLVVLAGFFVLGHLLNYFGQSVYWWWQDYRAAKEDEKMIEEQQKTPENLPDNVVRLEDVKKLPLIMSNYDDDTIH